MLHRLLIFVHLIEAIGGYLFEGVHRRQTPMEILLEVGQVPQEVTALLTLLCGRDQPGDLVEGLHLRLVLLSGVRVHHLVKGVQEKVDFILARFAGLRMHG